MKFKQIVFQNENWTPQNLFFSLCRSRHGVLLESGRLHPATGRYSILGLEPSQIFKARGDRCSLIRNATRREWIGNPFEFLAREMQNWKIPAPDPSWPPFIGGAIGAVGYHASTWFDSISFLRKPGLDLPDVYFMFFDSTIVFDHLTNKIWLIAREEAAPELEKLALELNSRLGSGTGVSPAAPPRAGVGDTPEPDPRWQSNLSKEQFERIVERAKEYIAAGDIFQANLAQRLTAESRVEGQALYETLTEVNPSPFGAYFKTPEFELISCSPERLVRLQGDWAETRPIAGTRPRSARRDEDEALARELRVNEKERAEHVMLLDLERNDLGKVCRYGSVEVNEFLAIEEYSHVRHLVSNVRGRICEGRGAVDLLKAVFPGGTITGTPKIRSIEIIDELEPARRDFYTGSLGYFSYTGAADFNILIRTFIKQGSRLHLHAGAGIVADSSPQREYEETWHKARALAEALANAENRMRNGSYSLS